MKDFIEAFKRYNPFKKSKAYDDLPKNPVSRLVFMFSAGLKRTIYLITSYSNFKKFDNEMRLKFDLFLKPDNEEMFFYNNGFEMILLSSFILLFFIYKVFFSTFNDAVDGMIFIASFLLLINFRQLVKDHQNNKIRREFIKFINEITTSHLISKSPMRAVVKDVIEVENYNILKSDILELKASLKYLTVYEAFDNFFKLYSDNKMMNAFRSDIMQILSTNNLFLLNEIRERLALSQEIDKIRSYYLVSSMAVLVLSLASYLVLTIAFPFILNVKVEEEIQFLSYFVAVLFYVPTTYLVSSMFLNNRAITVLFAFGAFVFITYVMGLWMNGELDKLIQSTGLFGDSKELI